MKKAWLLSMALVILIAGATSCGKYIPEESTPPGGDLNPPTLEQSDFNFIFKYGVTGRNTLDTFQSTFIKDMVMDPAVTIELTLSGEEKDSIYQKMTEIDFFNYPDEFTVTVPQGENIGMVTPHASYYFKVEYESGIKELNWEDKITNPDEKADKLRGLINFIRNIIESREEYKNLPEPKSGYI